MRQVSISNALALVTSLVAGVPDFVKFSAISDSSALPEPGCANFYGDDQHIRLYSGGAVFDMWVPRNDTAYNIGKPFARLNCNEISSPSTIRSPVCAQCWDRMNYVEILAPGSCSFALTDDHNKIFSMESDHTKGKNPFPVACYLALVTCRKSAHNAVRDIGNTQFSCGDTHVSNITMWTGSSEYILFVSANETVFDLIGTESQLGCVGPLGYKYAMCQACNFPVQTLTLSVTAGTCAFNLSGYADLVYHNARFGPLLLSSPTQIWSVQCGLDLLPFDTRDIISETQADPIACPAWADKTTIHFLAVDEGPHVNFDLEIRPDGSRFQIGRPPYSVGCLPRDKLYTDQCFPCTMSLGMIQIDNVNCLFEFFNQDNKTTRIEFWLGPREVDYTTVGGATTYLLSVLCHRKSAGEERSLQELSTNIIVEATTRGLGKRDSKLSCITGGGITLNTTEGGPGGQSFLGVPADMLYYSLAGSNPELECYCFWEPTPVPCHSCYDYEWISMLPSEDMEECRFKIEGWKEILVWPATDREVKYFDPPIKLLGVQCGFGHRNNPPANGVTSVDPYQGSDDHAVLSVDDQAKNRVERSKTSFDTAARPSQMGNVHHGQTDGNTDLHVEAPRVRARRNESVSVNDQCPLPESAYKVAIITDDGSMWFAPVPLDYEFHPMADMMCARLADGACASCSGIGTAVAVTIDVQWGPCIFFTEDHRQYFSQYWNHLPDGGEMVPKTRLDPFAIISGIECGSGA